MIEIQIVITSAVAFPAAATASVTCVTLVHYAKVLIIVLYITFFESRQLVFGLVILFKSCSNATIRTKEKE